MSEESVRVDSVDALKHFRAALFKFAESATIAIQNAESEMQATLNWLETEQLSHWQGQIRKRHDQVERAKESVRMKRVFKDSVGRTPAAIEEEKALRLAQLRLEEAERKLLSVKRYTRVLQREIQVYKGGVQRLVTTLESDIPGAAAMLDRLIETLESYIHLSPDQPPPPAPPAESHQPPPDQQAPREQSG